MESTLQMPGPRRRQDHAPNQDHLLLDGYRALLRADERRFSFQVVRHPFRAMAHRHPADQTAQQEQ